MAEDRDERLRARAYALWEQEGRPHGREADHWAAAEAELFATPAGAEAEPAPFDARPADAAEPPPAKPARKPRAAAAPRRRKISE